MPPGSAITLMRSEPRSVRLPSLVSKIARKLSPTFEPVESHVNKPESGEFPDKPAGKDSPEPVKLSRSKVRVSPVRVCCFDCLVQRLTKDDIDN